VGPKPFDFFLFPSLAENMSLSLTDGPAYLVVDLDGRAPPLRLREGLTGLVRLERAVVPEPFAQLRRRNRSQLDVLIRRSLRDLHLAHRVQNRGFGGARGQGLQ
jgi:hypothetical protein